MTKRKSKIVKELDPNDVEGFSEARIRHYLSLGYHPYLDENSKIKWLTGSQATLRGAKKVKISLGHNIFPTKNRKKHRRRRRRHHLLSFIRQHWLFILIVALVLIWLGVIYLFPNIVF